MASREMTASLVLILFGIGYLIYNTKYSLDSMMSPGPGVFPLFVGGFLMILAVYQLTQGFKKGKPQAEAEKKGSRASIKKPSLREILERAPLVMGTVLAIYLLMITVIGFFTSTFLFVITCSRIMGARDWMRPILLALGINLFCYFLFEVWLKLSLPRGYVF